MIDLRNATSMVRRHCLPLALLLATIGVLVPRANAATLVTVSGHATEVVHPDLMVVELAARSDRKTAVAAQAVINVMMGKAVGLARLDHAVKVRTGDYRVARNAVTLKKKQTVSWEARQGLRVSTALHGSRMPASFGRLLTRMQSAGLDVEGMHGALSSSLRERIESRALRDALARAELRLHILSVGLHERIIGIRTVGTNIVLPRLPFLPGRPMMMAAMVAAPVQAAPRRVRVSSTVTITAEMRFGTGSAGLWTHYAERPAKP
jgi:predicted secreted protein